MGCMRSSFWRKPNGNTPNPHIGVSQRPWVSTQTRNGQCLPYHGITYPSRYILYALCVDHLDLLFVWDLDQPSVSMTILWIIPWITSWSSYKLLEPNRWTSRSAYGQIHTMGSLDPSWYILYALCVDHLDLLFVWDLDQPLMMITTWRHTPWVVWDLPFDASPCKHT